MKIISIHISYMNSRIRLSQNGVFFFLLLAKRFQSLENSINIIKNYKQSFHCQRCASLSHGFPFSFGSLELRFSSVLAFLLTINVPFHHIHSLSPRRSKYSCQLLEIFKLFWKGLNCEMILPLY